MNGTTAIAIVFLRAPNVQHGGVETVANWLNSQIMSTPGYTSELLTLATSSKDPASALVSRPWSLVRRPLVVPMGLGTDSPSTHFGAWFGELELARYLPRRRLTKKLNRFDIIQVVSGSPAIANVAARATPPTCMHVATPVREERRVETPISVRSMRGIYERVNILAISALEHRVLRRADAIQVSNSTMMRYVQESGTEAVSIAPPGVDTDIFCPAPRNAPPYFLSVGRLTSDRKNFDGLVDAYAEAMTFGRLPWRLKIAGGGRMTERLQSAIKNSGVEAFIDVIHDPTESELLGLYRNAGLFVLPSHEEGLGISYLEALACGIPVLATANEGALEIDARLPNAIQLVPLWPEGQSAASQALQVAANAGPRPRAEQYRLHALTDAQFGSVAAFSRFRKVYEELLR